MKSHFVRLTLKVNNEVFISMISELPYSSFRHRDRTGSLLTKSPFM